MLVFLTMFLAFTAASAWADPITLNFDSLIDSTKVTSQFTGLTFANATAIKAGVTLNELEFPPKSGSNVLFNDGGAITITFTAPILNFEAYFTYDSRLTITAFDGSGNQIGSLSSQFTSNLALSGVAGSQPNERLSLSASGSIARIVISSSGSFVLDDLKYSASAAPVPEPATLALLLGGGAVWMGVRRKRPRKKMKGEARPLAPLASPQHSAKRGCAAQQTLTANQQTRKLACWLRSSEGITPLFFSAGVRQGKP